MPLPLASRICTLGGGVTDVATVRESASVTPAGGVKVVGICGSSVPHAVAKKPANATAAPLMMRSIREERVMRDIRLGSSWERV